MGGDVGDQTQKAGGHVAVELIKQNQSMQSIKPHEKHPKPLKKKQPMMTATYKFRWLSR